LSGCAQVLLPVIFLGKRLLAHTSVDSLEEKLEEAQKELGVDTHDYISITYADKVSWFQEILKFAPIVLIVGLLYVAGKKI
jgi:AFG3 family protein